jgi:hydroxyquinol 1,2-dioxygenase
VLGPFYIDTAPQLPLSANIARDAPGEPAYVFGRVLDVHGAPIPHAELDIWQTDGDGLYDLQRPGEVRYCRAKLTTTTDGRYRFRTVKPVSYPVPTDGPVGALLSKLGRGPYRPAHIHVIATAPGYERVATHLFVAGDPYLETDAVFGVKQSLVVGFEKHPPGPTPDGTNSPVSFHTAHFDFRLVSLRDPAIPSV